MEKYNAQIADNPKVALIHISRDQSDGPAEAWAAKEGFPWYTVLPDDAKRSDLGEYHTSGSVPFYTLLDANGEVVSTGSGVFKKAADL